ncbi:MAG: two-component sensor histidine kinase [Symbiobacteriaceae bacterium]|jgi:signal transduction histidine kinase|nr:two-component sensor histidine kinase [Symbiobacteriaceae bacterium]
MRKLSIVAKLWLAFTALILIVMVPLEIALGKLLTDFYGSQVTEPLLYHSRQLADLLASDPTTLDMAPMMGHMVGGEVLVLDRSGNPVDFPGASVTPAPPQAVAVATKSGSRFVGEVPLDRGSFIVTAVPVSQNFGAVVLLAPAAPLKQSLSLARRYLWLAGALTLLLGTGLALMLARSLLRPVIAIERATVRIARGDFSTRVDVETGDELGKLAGAVNQMTAQLEGYEKRRREFLANVAHELRTPLSYIRGYAQAVAEGLVRAPEEQERYLHIVQEESVRIGRLVDDLMDMAQMDEGQLSFDLQPLDLALPIGQAAAAIRPQAEEKAVAVEVSLPGDLPHPLADGGRMQQVVFNLLDNALRHTPAGGRLTVTARREGGQVIVAVADTGEGIPPEELPLVFERFRKRHSRGRGLGLAIVRSIVRGHGGEVGVTSTPGQGSTFSFTLPL